MSERAPHNSEEWTFARLSPHGEGGIGVFYLTGECIYDVLEELFSPASGDINATDSSLQYGWITDNGESIDEVIVRFVEREDGFTREPAVELNTHSGPAILENITSLLEDRGGNQLSPDEFLDRVERAGILDRIQREAYDALRNVETREGAAVLVHQLNGTLSRQVQSLANDLDGASSGAVEPLMARLQELIRLGHSGNAMTDPRELCILGPPNAGKSTLMNALAQQNTSIVHEDAGTTRDVVHDTVYALGYPFRVRDTAGLRASGDRIEQEGIQKAREMAADADLVLWVAETVEGAQSWPEFIAGTPLIPIRNKEDLEEEPSYGSCQYSGTEVLHLSAEQEEGLQELRKQIVRRLELDEELPLDEAVPFRADQVNALERAREALEAGDFSEAAEVLSSLRSTDTK